ncbi:MAG: NAD(P)-dependent oxidoreductase, partial [Pseudomonadota bacterium]
MPDTQSLKIGVIGVGIMGSAIATRLVEQGHSVTVYDPSQEKVESIVRIGGHAGNSPRHVTELSDYVILSLNHHDITRRAVFGEDGIAEAATADKLLIDMSSIDPDATAEMSAELAERTGMKWSDCPLSGGAPKAAIGELTIMAGGAPEDVDRAWTVMQHLAKNFTRMGSCGAGQTTKLVNQVLCGIIFQAVAEATELAQLGGVDAEAIPAALAGGRADSAIMQEYMAKMARHDYSPTGRLDNMLKDLEGA